MNPGALHLRPGAPLPALRSTRRALAPLLGRGTEAAQWPRRAAQLFALCGGAHRVAAHHAVTAAGVPAGDAPAADTLRIDTLREHLRRLWLDAARGLPGLTPPAAAAGCALLRDPQALQASRGWIDSQVFGQAAAAWLADWQHDPRAHVRRWAAQGTTWPARGLAAVQRLLLGAAQPVQALAAHASALELRRLAAQLQADEGFALAPTWRGHCAETGCWTRLADPLAQAGALIYAPLAMRHAARLADMARLLAPGGENALAQGALALGPGQGLGWCEMARGLLVHWVHVGDDGRLHDCRVIAPTEWNFHPFGAAARALSALPAGADAARVHALAAAYDPCVELCIETGAEAEHA